MSVRTVPALVVVLEFEGFRQPAINAAVCVRLEALVQDVGRLGRSEAPVSLVDCIAGHVEALDAMLHPTASALHQRFALIGDEATALDEASRR